jgi:hypothetical protein
MKFVSKITAFVAALAVTSVALAQSDMLTSQKNVNQVGEGDTSVVIENVKGKPGTAIFKTSGLKMVVLSDETPPAGLKVETTKPDTSDPSKNASTSSFGDNVGMANYKLCWRGVGRKGWHQLTCSKVSAKGVAMHRLATDVRGEVIALTPELRDADGKHITWVSHPAEARKQLHCSGKSQQASVFFIDANGNWRAATDAEAEKYDREEYANACKDAA